MSENRVDPVGVVGDSDVETLLRDAGFSVESGSKASIPDTDTIVAVGQETLTAIARSDADPLVLPVDAGRGVRSVPASDLPKSLPTLSDAFVEAHPVIEVTVGGEHTDRAVWDVTLVTADAARISEYSIETATDHVGTFRADGIVAATPAGSPDYARRIGGPVVSPSSVGSVAPIAPFATNSDHWVLPLESLTLTVERDEATVSLFVDGEDSGSVSYGNSVILSQAGTLRVAVVDASRSRFR